MLAAISHHASVRLAEIAFLLLVFSGIWFVSAELPQFRMRKARSIVAGTALALAGLLLIIATHFGSFG